LWHFNLLFLQWVGAADKLQQMVRSFTLRDLALVRRLSEQGVSLHAESALADNLHPLRGALTSMVGGGNFPTLVFKSEAREGTGFIQLLLDEDRHHAHILYLSPAIERSTSDVDAGALPAESAGSSSAWLALLDQAVTVVGRHGVHSLVAEVKEQGSELPILRQAGFAVYTRQDIWYFDGRVDRLDRSESSIRLLPYLSSDEWDIQLLYANTVPRLVQLVEPVPPLMTGDGWVLRDDRNDLVAFIHVHEGSAATWLRFFIHPNVEGDASEIVKTALQTEVEQGKKSIYCCVRRYEGRLPATLERTGFHIWGSQAVLVKHTVHHSRRTQPQMRVNLNDGGIPVTSPYVRRYPIQENQNDAIHSQEGDPKHTVKKKAFANQ
jgi:hypothetical protein